MESASSPPHLSRCRRRGRRRGSVRCCPLWRGGRRWHCCSFSSSSSPVVWLPASTASTAAAVVVHAAKRGKDGAGERSRKNAKPMRAFCKRPSERSLPFFFSVWSETEGLNVSLSHSSIDLSTFRSTKKKLHTMPPQQRPPPPPNARAVDAEASLGLRTLALQFEATGKWAQVRK